MVKSKTLVGRLCYRHWPTALVLLCLLVLYYFHTLYDISYLRDQVADGQWWRVFSGQFVHNNSSHLFSNMAALLLCRVLLSIVYSERDFTLSLLSCAFLTGVLIHFLLPSYDYYLGVSAALYGVLIAGALAMWRGRPYAGASLFVLVIAKLSLDYLVPDSVAPVSDRIGVPVAVEAHFVGVFAGVLVGVGEAALGLIRPAALPPK
ncbi:rhombosortase [Zhongshania arctica]|uniref:Rhombosortase n=1 Tax=Zhongshania arctica TaxID=3238302 RepID=A0ABV3U1D0_9GAMM